MTLTFIAAIATGAVVPLLLTSGGNGGSSSAGPRQVQNNTNKGGPGGAGQGQFQFGGNNNGQVGGTIINNGSTASAPGLSSNLQQRISELTGRYSDQGFEEAIFDRKTTFVDLYLKSGEDPRALYDGTSFILFGFESVDQNDDPIQHGGAVALLKTFQANGFKVDEELEDSYLMGDLTGHTMPLMFNTDLAPKGYTGGYQNGTFVGSLLFWIVQRSLGWGPTDEDIQVIKYLISQGADCKVPLSFLKYNGPIAIGDTGPYRELLPMMQSCGK